MCIFKRLEKRIFPSQRKIDDILEQNRMAWDELQNVITQKKEIVFSELTQKRN